MRPMLRSLALFSILLLPLPASAGTIVLDQMTDPFPPHPCLNSAQNVIFTGGYCDGIACPPDPFVSCPGSGFVEQVGLPGVLGGVTRTSMLTTDLAKPSSARIDPALTTLQIAIPEGRGLDGLWWTYSNDVQDWNLDLLAGGTSAVQVPVSGAITADHPLVLRVVLQDYSDNGSPVGNAQIDRVVTEPGIVVIPFSSFQVDYRVVFDSVDYISLQLAECGSVSCAQTTPARQFAVGSISFLDAGATPAHATTWGALKTRYR